MKKFDMYCDWSIYGIGIVVVESDVGVFYKREETTQHKIPQLGEMEGFAMCLDMIEELGLTNVTIHTDQDVLLNILNGHNIKFKKNPDLHKAFYGNAQRSLDLGVKVKWCKAHNGDAFSNAADVLTRKPVQESYEARMASTKAFHNKTLELIKPLPTMWDVFKSWAFVSVTNLTHGVAL